MLILTWKCWNNYLSYEYYNICLGLNEFMMIIVVIYFWTPRAGDGVYLF